jgi:hypothetical protein
MKMTIELPDTVQCAFINYVDDNAKGTVMVSKAIGSSDLRAGYKDCRGYEVENGNGVQEGVND